MFVSCRTRCGRTKLQINWNVCLEIRKCSRQILFVYWFRSICSNQNCGLSKTHATFLLQQILCECKKYASVLLLLPLIVSNLSLCWNRFLRRMKTNGINTVITRRTHMWASSASPAIIQTNLFSRVLSSNYLNEIQSYSWKHLSILSRLTKSNHKTHLGMLSETIMLVKTQPLYSYNAYFNKYFFLWFGPSNVINGSEQCWSVNLVCWRCGLSLLEKLRSYMV